MHPFLDVSKLTDDELLVKIGKTFDYLQYQTSLGHVGTVKSIQEVLDTLSDERNERIIKNKDKDIAKETSKSLEPIELGKLEEDPK